MICLDAYYSQLITLLVNRYNNRLLPILRHFSLISNRIYEFMGITVLAAYTSSMINFTAAAVNGLMLGAK
jgi:hypothetical protein